MAAPLTLAGRAFIDGTSRAVPARLSFVDTDDASCRLETEDGSAFDTRLLRVSDRLGRTPRTLELEEGKTFTCPDSAVMDRLRPADKGWFENVSRLEIFSPRLFVFLALVVAIIAATVRWGLPVAADFAAWATPPAVARAMNASTLATLDRVIFGGPTTLPEPRRTGLQTRFDRLTTFADGEAAGGFDLQFRDGGRIGPNALALPGGTIIVTDQLAALLSDDEIVAVMAHEIAHVTERHSLQQIYRTLGFAGLLASIGGDFGALFEEVLAGGGAVVAMAASREMETEADARGVELLVAAGENPDGLRTGLAELETALCPGGREACAESGWFSSHPGGAAREEALRRAIGDAR